MEKKTFNAFNDTPRGKHWLMDTPSATRDSSINKDKSLNDKVDTKRQYSSIFVNGFSSGLSVNDESTLKNKFSNDTIRKNENRNINEDNIKEETKQKEEEYRSIFSLFGKQPTFKHSSMSNFNKDDSFFKSNNDSSSGNGRTTVTANKNNLQNNIKRETLYKDRDSDLPLISPNVLDVSKQRLLISVLFIILQCYKIYDLIVLKYNLPDNTLSVQLMKHSKFIFVIKYFMLDSLFLFFLPTLNIPRLNFGPIMVLIQIIFMNSFNIYLSIDHDHFIWVSIFISVWNKMFHSKQLTLTGSTIDPHHKIINFSNHFKGALTIKILPENTALLNPLHESFCLPIDSNSPLNEYSSNINTVKVPIKINSTEPVDFIQLEYRDLYTNSIFLKNFTSKDFEIMNDIPQHWKDSGESIDSMAQTIRYLYLNLNDIGFYQIRKIVDRKGLNLKIYQTHLILPHCPMASVIKSNNIDIDKCIGDKDEISFEVHGIPPLKLFYSKVINDQVFHYNDKNLQPEYFESPLQSSIKRKPTLFNKNDIEDLKWARSYPVSINLDTLTSIDGTYQYKIDKVIDGLGNAIDFTTIDNDSIKIKYDLISTFRVHNIPKASLDEKFNPRSPTKKNIVINLESINNWNQEIPFSVNLSFIDHNGEESKKTIEMNSLSEEIVANYPGIYQLNSINSKYCPGSVIGKSKVLITKPVPPQLDVKSSPIIDPCVGPIGLDFDLNFVGVPPFHYLVKIYKLDKYDKNIKKLYDTKRITSKGARSQFKYLPSVEGNYEIVFDSLTNDIFTEQIQLIPLKNYSFQTSMRVKPSASIRSRNHVKNLCLNGNTKIPISFKGEPPFTLQYDIIETSSNRRRSFTKDNIMDNEYLIETPAFTVGGDYILSLVSIKDSSKCLVNLSELDAKIRVRRDIPTASFNFIENANASKIKQGSAAEIPIRLTGEAPFTIKYEHLDLNGNHLGIYEAKFYSNYKQSLSVFKEGIYRLKEMHDSSCNGKIENIENQYMVTYLSRPYFTIQKTANSKITKLTESIFTRNPVCQNHETTIDLSLFGSPPFVLTYELTSPEGQTSINTIQITTKYASLQLPNTETGEYIATIKSIYDTNYEEEDFKYIDTSNNEIIIKQIVNSIPQISFTDKGRTLRTCSVNIEQQMERKDAYLKPIKLKHINGQSPFSITFSVYHESTSRTDHITLDNVDIEHFPYYRLYEGLKLGKHIITMDNIIDANGCINEFANEHDNFISISITDVPKIHLLDANADYCVGDYVSYQLNGVPPFNIRYSFNGIELQSQERSTQFVRVASEPGFISINTIQDSLSQCVVNFSLPSMEQERERLSLTIHPIPSVTVSQGNYVIEDIHEGDQAEVVFTFEGTPPFSLTYVRTEDTNTNSNNHNQRRPQVVETHKVTDIYEYEYRVLTSLQGTYEAIEISDAFCFAKNEAFFSN
ncbi:Pom152p PWA37_004128 [Arxiozyma heterogenica]|uniref:Pom152p n=1 Tax=Arxiozyma heterogenica TaxID=278026 RepID=UPI002EF00680